MAGPLLQPIKKNQAKLIKQQFSRLRKYKTLRPETEETQERNLVTASLTFWSGCPREGLPWGAWWSHRVRNRASSQGSKGQAVGCPTGESVGRNSLEFCFWPSRCLQVSKESMHLGRKIAGGWGEPHLEETLEKKHL